MKKVIIVGILALGVAAFFYFGLGEYFSLTVLQENRDRLLDFTAANYLLAMVIFVGVYIAQTAFSLPGGAILTMAGGLLFGAVFGTLLVNIGATVGATLAFLAARYVLRDWVERKFGATLEPLQNGFADNAFSYLLMLRLIPAIPFFVLNLAAGLTRMRLGAYAAATALGILPGSFVFAYAGRKLGSINSLGEILSTPVILAFVFLALLALLPVVYRKLKARKQN